MPTVTRKSIKKAVNRYHHGDLRRALLQEAVRTIRDEGVEALTLREAGKRLGVSRTALYRHFTDKSALLAAVARDGFQRFRQALLHEWEQNGRGMNAFNAMGVAYVGFAVANPSHYRVMFGAYRDLCAKDPELQADAAAAFDVLLDALLSLQQAGDVRRDDPRQLALYVWAIVHGIATFAIDGLLGPDPRTADALIRFAVDRIGSGIAAEPKLLAAP